MYRGPFYLVSLPFRRSAFKGGGASSILANPVSTSSGTSPVSLFISERYNWELIHYFHEYITVTKPHTTTCHVIYLPCIVFKKHLTWTYVCFPLFCILKVIFIFIKGEQELRIGVGFIRTSVETSNIE